MGSVSFSDMSEPRPYLVCASQRSGSTLLVESLAATGVAGRPGEFFQYFASSSLSPQPREWFAGVDDEKIVGALAITDPGTVDTRTADQWRADVPAQGLTPSGVWGGKLMWNQTPLLIARTRVASGSLRTALRWLLGTDPLFVHVHRDDLVAQAVSMWRAVQTRVWRDSPEPSGFHNEGVPDEEAFTAPRASPTSPASSPTRNSDGGHGSPRRDRAVPRRVRRPRQRPDGHDGARAVELGQRPVARAATPAQTPVNARSKEWAQRYRVDAERNGYPL